MKNLTILLVAAAFSMVFAASSAQAQTTNLNPGPGQYTFTGPATLSVFSIITANCTLSLTGSVSKNSSGDVSIDVTDGSVTGGGTCDRVSLVFDPAWTTTVSQANLPTDQNPSRIVMAMFRNVIVTYDGLFGTSTCNGGPSDVPATFTNGNPISNPSQFDFDTDIGECSVDGTLDAEQDINVLVQ